MDYILFNSDGSIKARNLTDYIQKGNDGVNSIFVSVDGIDDLDSYTCSVNFELPNGDLTIATPTQMTSNDPITIDGVDYIGWLVPIDAQVTIYEGIVKFSLIITDIVSNPNKVLLTFNANLVINPSVVSPNDTTITVAQYNELITALNSLGRQKSDVNRVFITLDDISAADLTDYDEGQLFYDKTTRNYYVKDSNNDPNYVIYSFVANYKHNLSSGDTLEDLKTAYGSQFFLFKNSTDYGFCRIGYDSLILGWTATVFYFGSGGTIKHYLVTNQSATTTLVSIINGTATSEFATKSFLNTNYFKAPYTITNDTTLGDLFRDNTIGTLATFIWYFTDKYFIRMYPNGLKIDFEIKSVSGEYGFKGTNVLTTRKISDILNGTVYKYENASKKYVGDNFLKVHTFNGTATFDDIYDECGTNPFTLIYNSTAYYAQIRSEGPSGYRGLKIVNGEKYGYYVGPGTYTLFDFINYQTCSFVRIVTTSFSDTLLTVVLKIESATPFFLKVYDYGNNARSYIGCIRSSATKYYFEFEEVGTYPTGGDDTSILETPKYRYVGAISDVTTTLSSIFGGSTYREDYALVSEIKKLYKHHIIHFKEDNGNFSGADYYADVVSPSSTPVTNNSQLNTLLQKNTSFTPFYLWGGALVIGYFTPCSNTNALSPNDLENAFDDCIFVVNNDFSDTVTEL